MNPIYINATTLPDAWYQALYACIRSGREFIIDRGSYEGQKRLEFDYITIRIKYPGIQPLLPQVPEHMPIPNPVEADYLDEYLPYLMTGEEKKGESYTYGQRIMAAKLSPIIISFYDNPTLIPIAKFVIQDREVWNNEKIFPGANFNEGLFNQMELLIWTYKNKGYRNNQMVLQVAEPTDMLLQDPPCLRHIDTRIQDGELHFFPYFRSWDLWGGFPANLAAIQLMKEYIAGEIGVKDGEIVAASKGLHLYDYVWELAETLRGKTMDEFRREIRGEDDRT